MPYTGVLLGHLSDRWVAIILLFVFGPPLLRITVQTYRPWLAKSRRFLRDLYRFLRGWRLDTSDGEDSDN